MKSRVHLYTNRGPKTRGYIVADPAGLKELARAAAHAAQSVVGLDSVKFYTSDGHEYELLLVCDLTEEEWQTLPVPYDKKSDPDQLSVVKDYDEIRSTIK